MIVREEVRQDRRLAHRGVGTSHGRKEIEPALVDEEKCPRLSDGLIF